MVQLSRVIAGAALALALTASAASAAVCGPRDAIVSDLKKLFKEEVKGMGAVISGMGLVEVYVGPAPTRTFSIVITDTRKLSCIIYVGDGWQDGDTLMEGAKNARY